MPDPRFFKKSGAYSLAKICEVSDVALPDVWQGKGVEQEILDDVADLQKATAHQFSLLHNLKYKDHARTTKARAVFCRPQEQDLLPEGTIPLIAQDPYWAYALAVTLYYPECPPAPTAYKPGSFIAQTAQVAGSAYIHPTAVVEAGAEIGKDAILEAHSYIGPGVRIGNGTRVGASASVTHSLVGDHVYIYPGARIGQPGFGFAMSKQGFLTVPQIGRVVIEDYVEIGANTCIDRGSLHDTVIGKGTRVDNLVQIAHNVNIGQHCIIVSQVGISGSTHIDAFAALGGQAGITGHLHIGQGAQIAAQSGVMKDVGPGEIVGGSPAMPARQWHRQTAVLKKMTQSHRSRHDT